MDKNNVSRGPAAHLTALLLIAFAVFELWANTVGMLGAVRLRLVHILFLLPLCYMLHPAGSRGTRRAAARGFDLLLIACAVCCVGYMLLRYDAYARAGRLNSTDVAVGCVLLFLVFEAARRTSRNLALVALVFFAYYAYLGRFVPGVFGTASYKLSRVIKAIAWDTTGVLGTGANVSATYIFIFVIFGAFLKHSGFSKMINDLALALVGRQAGGPAKVSVLASALLGMINGSAVANVATTGTITIPLMKKSGYQKDFAAAVEAVASTGGQFTPPIMGAVGFVMAEFMSVSYSKIMLAAAVPAFLYYLTLLFSVHLEAKRLGLGGLSAGNIPAAGRVLRERGHLLLPLLALVALIIAGYTPLFSAVAAIFVTVAASWLRRETRMGFRAVAAAMEEGARSAIGVGASCLVIGVIIGSVNMTGLGLNFGSLVLGVVGEGHLLLGGVMVMLMSVILGMGVPGVAAYVIVYAVAVPMLRAAGAQEMAANLFCLIYACLSNITPPVAISSYVAAGIAESDTTKTSLIAMKLGVAGFILPFFFLDHPVLLLGVQEAALSETLLAVVTACAGMLAVAKGLSGLPLGRRSPGASAALLMQRAALVFGGLLFVHPAPATDIAALVLILTALAAGRKIPIPE